MAGYERKIHKILKKNRFYIERNPDGSHVIWSNGQIEVSVPAKIKSRHTANGILKQADIKRKI